MSPEIITESVVENDSLLTVGQMADFCGVSSKALRLYQDKGLLAPAVQDKATGYRYYTVEQFPIADRIFRLQNLGFSLRDIKTILEGQEPVEIAALYEQQLAKNKDELVRLEASYDYLKRYLTSQFSGNRALRLNKIVLEWMPNRHAYFFDLGSEAITLGKTHDEQKEHSWYRSLSQMKKELRGRGIPDIAFYEVSTVINQAHLERRDLTVDRACIILSDMLAMYFNDAVLVPGGFYLTMYCDRFFDENGEFIERKAILQMLDYAKEKGYRLRGDYIGSGNVDEAMTVESPGSRYMLLSIPVTL